MSPRILFSLILSCNLTCLVESNNNYRESDATISERSQIVAGVVDLADKIVHVELKDNERHSDASFIPHQHDEEKDRQTMRVLDELFKKAYDKRLRPKPRGGGPTLVKLDCYVRGISSIDELAMEYTLDLLVRERWNDPRLQFASAAAGNASYLTGNKEIRNMLWLPDLFFANEKSGYFHELTVPNIMLRIFPNGNILYSTRMSLTLSCDMNLKDYPFDVQSCKMQMGSFSYTEEALIFEWKEEINPIAINTELKLPKYNLSKHNTLQCRNEHYTGNFSCLRVEFQFNRELGYHLVQAYLPNVLLVIASWIGFWLDVESVPARVTLGVTTLLTTTAQESNIKNLLPPVSYTKAIDVWVGMCTCFVFMALVEFALVNYLARRPLYRLSDGCRRCPISCTSSSSRNNLQCTSLRMRQLDSPEMQLRFRTIENAEALANAEERLQPMDSPPAKDPLYANQTSVKQKLRSKGRYHAKTVDKLARVAFPAMFVIFILFYTLHYPVWSRYT